MDLHLGAQPLKRAQANPPVELRTHKSNGKPAVMADADDLPVPTLYREAGFAFRFRAIDRAEPPHIHVEGNGGNAKFWLDGSRLDTSAGYNRRQLRHIARIVEAHAGEFEARWHDYFG